MNKILSIFFILLLVLTVFTGCTKTKQNDDSSQQNEQNTPQKELLSINSDAEQAMLDANLKEATDLAKIWQLDSKLAYVEIQIPGDLSKNNGSELYVFSSNTDKVNWWTFSLNQATDKFVRAIIPKEDFLGFDSSQIDSKYWKMNYIKALQLVDSAGGSGFRASNTIKEIKIYLKQRQPNGWLWWTIQYIASDGTTYERIINPFNGEVKDPQTL